MGYRPGIAGQVIPHNYLTFCVLLNLLLLLLLCNSISTLWTTVRQIRRKSCFEKTVYLRRYSF